MGFCIKSLFVTLLALNGGNQAHGLRPNKVKDAKVDQKLDHARAKMRELEATFKAVLKAANIEDLGRSLQADVDPAFLDNDEALRNDVDALKDEVIDLQGDVIDLGLQVSNNTDTIYSFINYVNYEFYLLYSYLMYLDYEIYALWDYEDATAYYFEFVVCPNIGGSLSCAQALMDFCTANPCNAVCCSELGCSAMCSGPGPCPGPGCRLNDGASPDAGSGIASDDVLSSFVESQKRQNPMVDMSETPLEKFKRFQIEHPEASESLIQYHKHNKKN